MENIVKYKGTFIKNNIFLEDTILDFKLYFSKLTDKELSELFWLWEISRYKNSNKNIYTEMIIANLGEESANNVIRVDTLSFTVYNKYELIFREIKNRWLAKNL